MSDEDQYKNLGSIPLSPQQSHSHNPAQFYQHIALNISPEQLEGSQFVFKDDEKRKSRPLHEIMFSAVGKCYIGGLTLGGTYGAVQHWKAGNLKGVSSLKGLKISTKTEFVNAIVKRGSFVGNTVAVIAMFTTGTSGLCFGKLRDKDDVWNDIGGGALTGVLFSKSTKSLMDRSILMGNASLSTYRGVFVAFLGSAILGACFGVFVNCVLRGHGWTAWDDVKDTYEELTDRAQTGQIEKW